jgi:hypothetical protein
LARGWFEEHLLATILAAVLAAASPGCILRVWETAGKEGPLVVKVSGYKKAVETDLLERDLKELPIEGGAVSLPIRPHGLAALRLVP